MPSSPLRLATFNLKDFFLPRRPEENAVVEGKMEKLAASLRRARADVVAFQEVGAPELIERLVTKEVADLGYGAPVMGSTKVPGRFSSRCDPVPGRSVPCSKAIFCCSGVSS